MIISLSGKKRSGKSTVAKHLTNKGWWEVSWAYPLKEVIGKQLFGLSYEQMYGSMQYKEAIISEWGLSPRQILQVVGTDLFRRYICDDFWVRIGIRKIKELQEKNPNLNIVISDTRFLNEADAIKTLGGHLVWLHRENNPYSNDNHPSETALDDYKGWNLLMFAADNELDLLKDGIDRYIQRTEK